MTSRAAPVAALLTVLGLAAENTASAQPIAPPRRPTFSSYYSTYRPSIAGNGYYGGYGGYGGYGRGYGAGINAQFQRQVQQQSLLLQQQIAQTNQALAGVQNALVYGVNPNLPITGRGAVFNSLGHWYPGYGGGIGGVGTGGLVGGGPAINPLLGGGIGGGVVASPRLGVGGSGIGPSVSPAVPGVGAGIGGGAGLAPLAPIPPR